MAALIESIEAGGGGGELQIREGMFTISGTEPAEIDAKLITVDGLDISPKAVVIYRSIAFAIPATVGTNRVGMCFKFLDSKTYAMRTYYAVSKYNVSVSYNVVSIVFTENGFELYNGDYAQAYHNAQYKYVVLGM